MRPCNESERRLGELLMSTWLHMDASSLPHLGAAPIVRSHMELLIKRGEFLGEFANSIEMLLE